MQPELTPNPPDKSRLFLDQPHAYQNISTALLCQRAFLFCMLSRPKLASLGLFIMKRALSLPSFVHAPVSKPMHKIFCGGSTIEEACLRVQQEFGTHISAAFDYAMEGVHIFSGLDRFFAEYLKTIDAAATQNYKFAVLKLSAVIPPETLAKISSNTKLNHEEEMHYNLVIQNLESMIHYAKNQHVSILVDAEHSWIQPAIDRFVENLIFKYNQFYPLIYQTVQMYRHDRFTYLKNLIQRCSTQNTHLGVKLVRGAYLEEENARAQKLGLISPVFPCKEDTDAAFNQAANYCLDFPKQVRLFLGTHNLQSTFQIKAMADQKSLLKQLYFSQLFGMCDEMSYNLSKQGAQVVKYVPFGPIKFAIPYLLRRAEENSSASSQAKAELPHLIKEIWSRLA